MNKLVLPIAIGLLLPGAIAIAQTQPQPTRPPQPAQPAPARSPRQQQPGQSGFPAAPAPVRSPQQQQPGQSGFPAAPQPVQQTQPARQAQPVQRTQQTPPAQQTQPVQQTQPAQPAATGTAARSATVEESASAQPPLHHRAAIALVMAIPRGFVAGEVRTSGGLGISYEQGFRPSLSFLGTLDYIRGLNASTTPSNQSIDFYNVDIGARLRRHRFFVDGGIGYHHYSDHTSGSNSMTESGSGFGFRFGAGIDFPVNRKFIGTAEIAYSSGGVTVNGKTAGLDYIGLEIGGGYEL